MSMNRIYSIYWFENFLGGKLNNLLRFNVCIQKFGISISLFSGTDVYLRYDAQNEIGFEQYQLYIVKSYS